MEGLTGFKVGNGRRKKGRRKKEEDVLVHTWNSIDCINYPQSSHPFFKLF